MNIFATSKPKQKKKSCFKVFPEDGKVARQDAGYAKIGIKQWRVEHFVRIKLKKLLNVFPEHDTGARQKGGVVQNSEPVVD